MTLSSPWPDRLFDSDRHPGRIRLVGVDGGQHQMDTSVWHHVSDTDHEVLTRVEGPVLDVGCGPGRHCGELAARGVEVLGLDPSEAAVRHASKRGAPIHHGSIFGPVPRLGEWRTILLLDCNVGIGGEPIRLLRRCGELLSRGGRVLVETEPPGIQARSGQVRVEMADDGPKSADPLARQHSGWFPWATVPSCELDSIAEAAGFKVAEVWRQAGRWFGDLRLARDSQLDELEASVA